MFAVFKGGDREEEGIFTGAGPIGAVAVACCCCGDLDTFACTLGLTFAGFEMTFGLFELFSTLVSPVDFAPPPVAGRIGAAGKISGGGEAARLRAGLAFHRQRWSFVWENPPTGVAGTN